MKNTKIEWAHHTVNFWWGCSFARYLHSDDVREECLHCYALTLAKLFSKGKATWGETGRRWIRHEAARRELYALDKALEGTGRRERVFINSMSDTFEARADLDEARSFLWDACQWVRNLDLLLLTKRPGNVAQMVPARWMAGDWPAHVWLGTTAGTQRAADENIPQLLSNPAKVRFLSCEPLLGPVNLDLEGNPPGQKMLRWYRPIKNDIHWVICGGESGPKARPMHPAWARSLRDQCAAAGVPFHFKQWGEWLPGESTPDSGTGYRRCDDGTIYGTTGNPRRENFGTDPDRHSGPLITLRIGKTAAGRLLDGREHNAFPTP